ncbi:lasso peptide biosynthesis B2 protein [Actinoplanes sp. NPDC023714]|uniref:lasso peptide biosynthesis B2 protein n=1 Tax=Actinoplanes sp. NPDC023714 TaxID=3154322 RepID=UPI003402FA3F
MSTPAALTRPARPGTPGRRLMARSAVLAAHGLATLPPARLRAVLAVLRRGAGPATYAEAEAARNLVLAVSLRCLGPKGCLPRSLATVLLCPAAGRWPTWCVGVRVAPPFAAHSWVEAEGRMVGEPMPAGYLATLFTLPPHVR